MAGDDLSLKDIPQQKFVKDDEKYEGGLTVFKFSIRPIAIYIWHLWKLILGVFFALVISFWFLFHYIGNYSDKAWTAEARIFHQTRSEKIPSFYKQMDTNSVIQFICSQGVRTRVANNLDNSGLEFDKGMLGNVSVTTGNSKQHVISVVASASTPEVAAAIANSVADEGVAEYINRQNNSLRTMISEKERQKGEISEELKKISETMRKARNSDTISTPVERIIALKSQILALETRFSELKTEIDEIDVRIREIDANLKVTPKEEEYETSLDNTGKMSIESKEVDLMTLRQRYTDDNPKVKSLLAEIEMMKDIERKEESKGQKYSKIVYRKNEVYHNLETQKLTLNIDRTVKLDTLSKCEEQIKKLRATINESMPKCDEYSDLEMQEKTLISRASKIDDSISDLQFLISTAVPDVYVFERAEIPSYPNLRKSQAKVIAFSIFLTALFAISLAAVKIAKLKFMDSAEFKFVVEIADLGEIPETSSVNESVYLSSINSVFQQILEFRGDRKVLSFLRYGDSPDYDRNIKELIDAFAIKGHNLFRLKCLPSSSPEAAVCISDSDDAVSQKLVAVSKHLNDGVFVYRNDYSMDTAELDLLHFDIGVLSEIYDIVIIENKCENSTYRVAAQLSALSGAVVIVSAFDDASKVEVYKAVTTMKTLSKNPIGGVLIGVPKAYYKE